MSHDLVLQTKIGREETLEKFLHTIGKKARSKIPVRFACAVSTERNSKLVGLRRQELCKLMQTGSSRD